MPFAQREATQARNRRFRQRNVSRDLCRISITRRLMTL
ncbi:hypothetical protein C7S13_0931 [Burkholderia cepacia]|nr:hypothetical protein [Burkholderia cepacia]MDW9244443.1 hypothetical protein [Burkholderia cepacia]QOH33052.1 hypothetical protein C7S14_6788 [Burkholderia cepacia]